MTTPLFLVVILFFLSALSLSLAQSIRYVSPTGSDASATCTEKQSPCATLRHAVTASSEGDIIRLLDGQYFEPVDSAAGSIVLRHSLTIEADSGVAGKVTVEQRLEQDAFCHNTSNANKEAFSGEHYMTKCALFVFDDGASAQGTPVIRIRNIAFQNIFFGIWNYLAANSSAQVVPKAQVSIENVGASNVIFGFASFRQNFGHESYPPLVQTWRQLNISNVVVRDSTLQPLLLQQLNPTRASQYCAAVATHWNYGFITGLRFENVSTMCEKDIIRSSNVIMAASECNYCLFDQLQFNRCSARDILFLKNFYNQYPREVSFQYVIQSLSLTNSDFYAGFRSYHVETEITIFSARVFNNTLTVGQGIQHDQSDYSSVFFFVAAHNIAMDRIETAGNMLDVLFSFDSCFQVVLSNSNIEAGYQTTLGCIRSVRNSLFIAYSNVFDRCYSSSSGGALASLSDLSVVLRDTVVRRAMSMVSGGALSIQAFWGVSLFDNTFEDTYAAGDGGGIFLESMGVPGFHVASFLGTNVFTRCTAGLRGSAFYLSNVQISHETVNEHFTILATDNSASSGTLSFHQTTFYSEYPPSFANIIVRNNRAQVAGCYWIEDPKVFPLAQWQQMVTCDNNTAAVYAPEYSSAPVRIKLLSTELRTQSTNSSTYVARLGERFMVTVALEDFFGYKIRKYPSIMTVRLTYKDKDDVETVDMSVSTTVAIDNNDMQPTLSLVFSKAPLGKTARINFSMVSLPNVDFLNIPVEIEPCQPGTRVLFDELGGQSCDHCEMGHYSHVPHSKSCTPCPKGFYAPNLGMSMCTACPSWTLPDLQDIGQTSIDQCQRNTIVLICCLAVISVVVLSPILLLPCTIYLLVKRRQLQKKARLVDSLLKNDYLSLLSIQMQEQGKDGFDATQTLMSRLPPQLRLSRDDIHIGQILGSGSQASLFSGVFQGSAIALKLFQKLNVGFEPNSMEDFVREVEIQARFGNHPNIVRLIGVCDFDSSKVGVVVELMKGSLASMIQLHNALYKRTDGLLTMSWKQKKHILKSIAAGMAHLHSHGVIHRDLKLENVLTDDDSRLIKICDFGFSKVLSDQRMGNSSNLTMNVGTASYICPELIGGTVSSPGGSSVQGSSRGGANSGSARDKLLPNGASSQSYNDSSTSVAIDMAATSKIDVYSYGILMSALFLETTKPYGDRSDVDIIWGVKSRAMRPEIDEQLIFASTKILCEKDGLSRQQTNDAILEIHKALELMRQCWTDDPNERPSFKDILRYLS